MRRLLLLFFLTSCRCDPAASSGEAIAQCSEASGDVRRRPSQKTSWSTLDVGQRLARGDWVQTAAESAARIDFSSGARLSLGPSALVVIEEARQGEDGPAGALLAESTIEVRVVEGKATVATRKGQERAMKAGESAKITGETITAPTPEPPEPPPPPAAPPPGPETEEAITDRLIAPPHQAVISSDRKTPAIVFRWEAVEGATDYSLVIASDARLSDVIVRRSTADQELEIRELQPGDYHWGVFAERPAGSLPLFLEPRLLSVRRGSPDLRVPSKLRWK